MYISSIGAKHTSNNFYLRIKGEIELALQQVGFADLSIVRPSMLLGDRQEKRMGESIGKIVMLLFTPFLLFSNYKPIHAQVVAAAMRRISKKSTGFNIYSSSALTKIAKDKYDFKQSF